jgi:hypothetical protein
MIMTLVFTCSVVEDEVGLFVWLFGIHMDVMFDREEERVETRLDLRDSGKYQTVATIVPPPISTAH